MKKLALVISASIICLAACSGPNESKLEAKSNSPVKNVIFLIGDGMGLAQVSKAIQQSDQPLNLEKAHYIGLSKTSSATEVITDSAASATAFSIGVKTSNGSIGLDANGRSKKTIIELLSKEGYSTGLIATSSITHATPASFYAHVESRENYYEIAEGLVDAPVNLFIGGGEDHFDKRSNQKRGEPDERNLIKEMQAKGVTMVNNLGAIKGVTGRVGYFTAGAHPDPVAKGRSDYLSRSIQPSIDFLSKEGKAGFFLMAEGSQIDWGGHANDLEYTMSELYDFDKAIGEAMKFADKNPDTLVLITADHETGGLTLPTGDMDATVPYAVPGHAYSTMGHTSAMVPVYAYGKGAERFKGVYENTAIYHKILRAMGK